jgi:hypothetical protein
MNFNEFVKLLEDAPPLNYYFKLDDGPHSYVEFSYHKKKGSTPYLARGFSTLRGKEQGMYDYLKDYNILDDFKFKLEEQILANL